MTVETEKRLLLAASNTKKNPGQLVAELKLPLFVGRTKVYRSESAKFWYRKENLPPPLSNTHCKNGGFWTRRFLRKYWNDLGRADFCDERKVICDRPDGLLCYWHNLWKSELCAESRQYGGGGKVSLGGVLFAWKILDGTCEAMVEPIKKWKASLGLTASPD